MNRDAINAHQRNNRLQSLMLVITMGALLALLGFTVGGRIGVILAIGLAFMVTMGRNVSPRIVLRLYKARPIQAVEAPGLLDIVAELSRRAGLSRAPSLYYIPSPVLNAFAAGGGDAVVIGLTDGILRRLSGRELVGVLAHEISHVRNGDTYVMGLADVMSRLTHSFSLIGQLGLLVSLPMMLVGIYSPPWILLLLLVFAPTLSALLQLALSRTREFDADIDAVELTGDPEGLASALMKLERLQGGIMERVLMPGRRVPDPSILRTHPATEQRVRRLLQIAGREPAGRSFSGPFMGGEVPSPFNMQAIAQVEQPPRWRMSGLWH